MSEACSRAPRLRPLEALWQRVRKRLETETPSSPVDCWLEDADLSEDTHGRLVLRCSNAFSRNWVKDRYQDILTTVLKEETGREVTLAFELSPPESLEVPSSPHQISNAAANPDSPERRISYTCAIDPSLSEFQTHATPVAGWNSRFNFSNFVVGTSNRFAWSAAQEICRGFRREYNPLLIQSPTALGKTHLGQAIAHSLHVQDPTRRIQYCPSEQLFTELIQHLRDRNILAFKEKYRKNCEVLILDDVQFVCKKTGFQSELTYTLDFMLNSGKQVVLLADLPPEQRNHLQESLRSRLFSGLAVSMDMPDFDTRLAILRQLAHLSQLSFSEPLLEALADLVRSHVRDIEAAFKRLVATHNFSNQPIDTEAAREVLGDFARVPKASLTIRHILNHVSQSCGIEPEVLCSRSRRKAILFPRQLAMYLCRRYTLEPLHAIGRQFRKDHSSVIYALKSLERKLAQNPRLRREAQFIEDRLFETLA